MSTSRRTRNFTLEVGRGNIPGTVCVSKFGEAPSGVQATATDIWSRADATPTQQVWLAPTAARIHAILSTSDADSDTGGTVAQGGGARTIRVYGLKTWASAETSEDIIMDGTATGGNAYNTVNSYVIIHRMKVLTSGATNINVGTITATAASDATITAVILPGDGQTEMAIYGVPSTQTMYLTRWSASIDKATGAVASCDFSLRVNSNPDVQTTNFIRKEDLSLQSTGSNFAEKHYDCYPVFSGPCIIKVQGIASAADLDAHSGFDGFVVTN